MSPSGSEINEGLNHAYFLTGKALEFAKRIGIMPADSSQDWSDALACAGACPP